MAKLPSLEKILQEQFPDLDFIAKLAAPINRFMEETWRALKNIGVDDNMDGSITTMTIDTLPCKLPVTKRPKVVIIGAIRNEMGSPVTLVSPVTVNWEFDGQVVITQLLGLTPSSANRYQITFLILNS